MCGIVGCQGKNHRQWVRRGLVLTRHRGPDETAVKTFVHAAFSFGINRLAIRDTRNGMYPFSHHQCYLVFNGEIYNTHDLRRLIHFTPRTRCDGELILPLFLRYGTAGFDRMIGMFAVAIYDAKRNRLILARDKFGEKPLYYQMSGGHVRFGSELKVFASDSFLSSQALVRYVAFGYQPFRSTIYEGVDKVLPGEVVTISLSTHEIRKEFYSQESLAKKLSSPRASSHNDLEETVEALDFTLRTIVCEKQASDVPIGIYLSGGVDSGLLAALIARDVSKKIKTFSIKFDTPGYDESRFSREVATFLHSDHQEISISDKDIGRLWSTIMNHMDEPFADPAIFPTYLLSSAAKERVTVIMSGEGADEFFGGYPRFRTELRLHGFPRLPDFLNQALWQLIPSHKLARILIDAPEKSYTSARYHTLWQLNRRARLRYSDLIHETWRQLNQINHASSFPTPLNLFLYDLFYYVGEQLCMKVDKMTMLHSLESRAPYLDERLYPFMELSALLLRQGYQDKYLLRQVAQRYLPQQIAEREKHGFSLPLEYWLRAGLRNVTEEAMDLHHRLQEVVPKRAIRKFISDFLQQKHNDDLSVWNILVLDSWLKKHIKH